jgi:excisionase family DNA binding protein
MAIQTLSRTQLDHPATTGIPDRALYTVAEARQLLGSIGHSTLYGLVAAGKIRIIKIGRRTYVSADEIARIARDGA